MKSTLYKFTGRDYVRELVRIRDNWTCQKCGKRWEPGKRRFDIHHLNECGKKSRGYDRKEDMGGLITYCHKCHLTLDSVRNKMSKSQEEYWQEKQELYSKVKRVLWANGKIITRSEAGRILGISLKEIGKIMGLGESRDWN